MTNELLRCYAVDGSESAFTELVRQHIDLVYSAALRQVNGDAAAAQDITQAVFTDLARKAARLIGHASLTGWLYTSVRFEAGKSRRAEQRRHAREYESHAMNQLLRSDDPADAWHEMRPVLDDVMHELNDADRDAVLLRFFERKPLAEIGARLGLSENAARMRVERALEKLRAELSKRGITSTGAAVAAALTERAVNAAPARLIAEVSKSALAAAELAGGLSGGLLGPIALKWLGGAALVSLSVALWTRHVQTVAVTPSTEVTGQAATQGSAASAPAQTPLPPAAPPVVATPSLDTTNKLVLHIVTADSGKPVVDVDLDYWTWEGGKVHHNKPLHANRFGICEVPVERSTVTKLILVSERPGFADTRLQWHTDQGEKIPEAYTLRLARAASIGGTVVDDDGNPVSGAKIGFNNRPRPDPAADLKTETSNFGWPFWIVVTSDSAGHWEINQISREAVHTLDGGADHEEHLRDRLSVAGNAAAEKQLLAGAYVFHLGRGLEVYGDVVDASGKPISDARVRVGYAAMIDTRKAKTRRNGTFSVGGCKPEKTPLSADANDFATTTIEADLGSTRGPFHLVLQTGKLLRLRVVGDNGNAISNAAVFLNNLSFSGPERKALAVQADFERRTDAEGRVEWDHAPDGDLLFDVTADGYSRGSIHFAADGNEHTITLSSFGLTLFGSVTDAATGQPIPAFRIIVGWPEKDFRTGEMGAAWSTLDRFWFKFEGGAYRHRFGEPALGGPNPGFLFKFEADGYAPFVTRSFQGNEGEMQLDVAMQPSAPINITVLLPDGQPAVKADIGLVSAGAGLRLLPGALSHDNLQSVGSLLATDGAGHFTLNADDTVKSVFVAHPEGFLQTTPAELTANPTAQLQSWSRIEGTLFCDGQPAPNRDLRLLIGNDDDFQSIYSDLEKFKVTTDSEGRFVFPQAPPGERKLVLMVSFDDGRGHKGWSNRLLTNLDLPPGETVTIAPTTTIPAETVIRPDFGGPQASGR